MIQDHIYVLIDMKVYVTSDEDLIICEARPRSLLFLSLMEINLNYQNYPD